MKRFTWILLLILLCNGQISAQSDDTTLLTTAATRYLERDFSGAIEAYAIILDHGVRNAAIYFNLANAWQANGNQAHALLNYRRAQLLDPHDGQISAQIRQLYTAIGRSDPLPTRYLVSLFTRNEVLVVVLILWSGWFFLLSQVARLRRWKLWPMCVITLLILITVLYFVLSRSRFENAWAVTLEDTSATLAPNVETPRLFNILDATEVLVLQEKPGWLHIQVLADGREGWIKQQTTDLVAQ